MAKEIKKRSKFNIYYFLERYFKIIAAVLFVVVLLLGYFMVISGQMRVYFNYQNIDLVSAISENQRLLDSQAYLEKVAKSSFISPEENVYLSMAVPDNFDFTAIASQLTSLAQAYGFNVTSIQADKIKSADASANKANSIQKIKINLNIIGGDFSRLKSFLDGMEKSAMIFDIQSISFGANGSYQLEILAYYFN